MLRLPQLRCGGPGDEGQPSTAAAPGKPGTHLRAGGGPCPEHPSPTATHCHPPAGPGAGQQPRLGRGWRGTAGRTRGSLLPLQPDTGAPSVVPGCPAGARHSAGLPVGLGLRKGWLGPTALPGRASSPGVLATTRTSLLAPRPGEGQWAPPWAPTMPGLPSPPQPPVAPAPPVPGPSTQQVPRWDLLAPTCSSSSTHRPRGCPQRGQPGPRSPSPALLLRHVPPRGELQPLHEATHVPRADAPHGRSTRGDPDGLAKVWPCLEVPGAAPQQETPSEKSKSLELFRRERRRRLCHRPTAPAFQRPPLQEEKGSGHPPAETGCFLIAAPGERLWGSGLIAAVSASRVRAESG